jgi:hypothetical protein
MSNLIESEAFTKTFNGRTWEAVATREGDTSEYSELFVVTGFYNGSNLSAGEAGLELNEFTDYHNREVSLPARLHTQIEEWVESLRT